jgi:hypothetical protein
VFKGPRSVARLANSREISDEESRCELLKFGFVSRFREGALVVHIPSSPWRSVAAAADAHSDSVHTKQIPRSERCTGVPRFSLQVYCNAFHCANSDAATGVTGGSHTEVQVTLIIRLAL